MGEAGGAGGDVAEGHEVDDVAGGIAVELDFFGFGAVFADAAEGVVALGFEEGEGGIRREKVVGERNNSGKQGFEWGWVQAGHDMGRCGRSLVRRPRCFWQDAEAG